MPAPPELGDIHRTVRHLKVLHETEAHHARTADSHIRIAGKIAIYLHRISQQTLEQRKRIVGARGFEDKVNMRSDLVRDHQLFHRPHAKL